MIRLPQFLIKIKILITGKIKEILIMKIVDTHVHLWIEKFAGKHSHDISLVNERKLITACLKDFKKNDGSLAIDCTPYECGRNGNMLFALSEETGVKILGVTGFHRREYYPQKSEVWEFDLKEAEDFFKGEIQKGLRETLNNEVKLKASVIKIPFLGAIKSSYLTLTKAAIKVALETGAPVLVHTERGENVEWFSDFLLKSGVDPERVMLCHIDKRDDSYLHQKLADKGFYLEYDTFLRPRYNPDKNVYRLMEAMIKKGFGYKILVGSDIADNKMWKNTQAEKGYGGFFADLKTKLCVKFENMAEITNILGKNAINFLSCSQQQTCKI